MKLCAVHPGLDHQPEILLIEEHHVIPQAWQHFALTGNVVQSRQIERLQETRGSVVHRQDAVVAPLFDPRTVAVGPTCHRNVHHYIVFLMRLLAEVKKAKLAPSVLKLALDRLGLKDSDLHRPEFDCAQLALKRYVDAGYDLTKLMAASLWGVA